MLVHVPNTQQNQTPHNTPPFTMMIPSTRKHPNHTPPSPLRHLITSDRILVLAYIAVLQLCLLPFQGILVSAAKRNEEDVTVVDVSTNTTIVPQKIHPSVSMEAFEDVKHLIKNSDAKFQPADRVSLASVKKDGDGSVSLLSKDSANGIIPNTANENPLYVKEMHRNKHRRLPCMDGPICRDKFSGLNGDTVLVNKMCLYGEDGKTRMRELCPASCNSCNQHLLDTPSGVVQILPLPPSTILLREERVYPVTNETANLIYLESYYRTKVKRVKHIIDIGDSYVKSSHIDNIKCINRHEECAIWASEGACEAHPQKMFRMCGPACLSCQLLEWEQTPFQRHDFIGVFEAIKFDKWKSPHKAIVYENLYSAIPIASFDNMLSNEECNTLIKTLKQAPYAFSDGDHTNDNIKYSLLMTCEENRNSDCYEGMNIKTLRNRLSNATGIPSHAIERFFIEKHGLGDFRSPLLDLRPYIQDSSENNLNVFMIVSFLNYMPQQSGGSLAFPNLNLSFNPFPGRSIMIPLVKDFNHAKFDYSTMFESTKIIDDSERYTIVAIVKGPEGYGNDYGITE